MRLAFIFVMFALIGRAADPPFTLTWIDKRPIGQHILGDRSLSTLTNPRGWHGPLDNYSDAPGMAAFKSNMLYFVDQEVLALKSVNAQGIIIWDIEGDELSISYLGDPRNLSTLAPEMDAAANDFFAKFTSAGLRVGITVRSQEFQVGTGIPTGTPTNGQAYVQTDGAFGAKEWKGVGGSWTQTDINSQEKVAAYYTDLLSKMEYAHTRWGCTIFYLDSFSDATDYGIQSLTNIMVAHPDFLLAPEGGGGISTRTTTTILDYFAMGVPYLDPTFSGMLVPTPVPPVYPNGFGLVSVHDQWSDSTNLNNTVSSIKAGNILLFDGHDTNSSGTLLVKAAYQFLTSSPQTMNVGTAIFR